MRFWDQEGVESLDANVEQQGVKYPYSAEGSVGVTIVWVTRRKPAGWKDESVAACFGGTKPSDWNALRLSPETSGPCRLSLVWHLHIHRSGSSSPWRVATQKVGALPTRGGSSEDSCWRWRAGGHERG
jgi:hypothetical protein